MGIKKVEIIQPCQSFKVPSIPKKIQEKPEEVTYLIPLSELEKEVLVMITFDRQFFASEENLITIFQNYFQLFSSNQLLEGLLQILNLNNLWLFLLNDELKIVEVGEFVCERSNLSKEELIGKSFDKLLYLEEEFKESLRVPLLKDNPLKGIFRYLKKNGEIITLEGVLLPLQFFFNKYYLFLGKDISELEKAKKKLSEKVLFDPFLNVLNLAGFLQSLEEKIKFNPFQQILIILIKINNFKNILQNYGYLKVEKALQYLFNQLKEILSFQVTWGRLSPELLACYILLNPEEKYIIKGLELAEKISKISQKHIPIEEHSFFLNLSMGLVCYPHDGEKAEVLLNRAELALKNAEKEGKPHFFYSIFFENEEKREAQILELISYAVENNRFLFHLQPIFNAQTEELAGFEALVRILDKNNNLIYPSQFIDVLEKSFYLKDFEKWCVKKLKEILETFLSLIPNFKVYISLNLTPVSFLRVHFINELIDFVIKGYDRYLMFEVTERIFLENLEQLSNHFKLFKKTLPGLKIAIDDFGTGTTFLRSFLEHPIDLLKIDQYYISKILEDPKALKMVKTVIDIAKEFGLQTVAEGVENQEQFLLLKNIKCDFVQGFYFSPPLSEDETINKFKEFLLV